MSSYAEKVKRWYDAGNWSEKWVRQAYAKRKLTAIETCWVLGIDLPEGADEDDAAAALLEMD